MGIVPHPASCSSRMPSRFPLMVAVPLVALPNSSTSTSRISSDAVPEHPLPSLSSSTLTQSPSGISMRLPFPKGSRPTMMATGSSETISTVSTRKLPLLTEEELVTWGVSMVSPFASSAVAVKTTMRPSGPALFIWRLRSMGLAKLPVAVAMGVFSSSTSPTVPLSLKSA